MTYANVLKQQAKAVFAFATITRRKLINYSALDGSGNVSFPYGTPVSVFAADGTATNASINTAIIVPPDWSYNSTTEILTLPLAITDEFGDSFASLSSAVFYVEYESHYATEEVAFHEIPTNSASSVIKWSEGLIDIPTVRRTVADNFAGLLTSDVSPLVLAHNGEDLFESLYDDSFFRCRADIWTCVGPLRTTNCRKLFSGLIDSITLNDLKMELALIENTKLIDGSYRGRFFSSDLFSKLDPGAEGQPIPICYGTPRWVRAVNIDYIADGATTSDNRVWAVYDKLLCESGTQNISITTVASLGGSQYRISAMAEADVRALTDGDYIQRSSDGSWAFVVDIESATQIVIQTITVHTPTNGNTYVRPAIQR